MNEEVDYILMNDLLKDSKTFEEDYIEYYSKDDDNSITTPLLLEISSILNYIVLEYEKLNAFQIGMLEKIFEGFLNLRILIDPNLLKPFNHYMNDDDDLLLFRKTPKGLVNLIIYPEDCIAFSFISNDSRESDKLYFIRDEGDFKKVAYNFFSF